MAAATAGELWARRAAYARETAWAPPYVAGELRDAHIAEDTYRADAVRAWHQADAAADRAGRKRATLEAEQFSALAQEIGSYREQLTQIADARRAWNAATEVSRQRALTADTELRRRHPDIELPPLHPREEASGSGTVPEAVDPDVEARQSEPSEPADRVADAGPEPGFTDGRTDAARLDIKAALEAASRAQDIVAERARQPDREAELDSDEVMRRREAEARQEVEARRGAVRQDPAPSRHLEALERDELELEA